MSEVVKFFTKTAVSAARSLLLSEVKGSVKSLLDKKRAKTIEDIHQEMMKNLGYITSHYTINKKTQEISYKSSPIFIHEWLTNSPLVKEKILRDEENGHIYINDEQITNAQKLNLINKFISSTNIKTASLSSHFDNAIKLLEPIDINALKFKRQFTGWNSNNQSIVNQFLFGCFGINDQLSVKLWRKWIIGAARRIITPGCSFDGCLILRSKPGTGKTSWFRQLLPPPFDNRAGEVYCNIKNPQKFVENIAGKSIVNFDELSPLDFPQTTETFKQLLSLQGINVRLAWRRNPQHFALRSAFGATTNKLRFISDPTLSRRLWTINLPEQLDRLDFAYLAKNRTELWKEALYYAEQGEIVYLTADEQREVQEYNTQFLMDQ